MSALSRPSAFVWLPRKLKRKPIALPCLPAHPSSVLAMSSSTLADRMAAVTNKKESAKQSDQLNQMSLVQLQKLTIKFGQSKVGQTYQQVVTDDPKYCQWFLRKYHDSRKDSHAEFVHFLKLWVERQELEMDLPTWPEETASVQPKAKSAPHMRVHLADPIDLEAEEDEEIWDAIETQTNGSMALHNARRLDHLENTLMEVLGQLRALTQPQSVPVTDN